MANGDKTLLVTVVTPYGVNEEYNVRHLRAPGGSGDFGVLPGHIPFMTTLRPGAIEMSIDGNPLLWATSGGYAEVNGDRVTILAETAERSDRIDVERAEASRRRAEERLSSPQPDMDELRTRLSLIRAINRIRIASRPEGG